MASPRRRSTHTPGAGRWRCLVRAEESESLAFQWAVHVLQGRIAEPRAEKDIAVAAGHQHRSIGRHGLHRALPHELQAIPQGIVQSLVVQCVARTFVGGRETFDRGWTTATRWTRGNTSAFGRGTMDSPFRGKDMDDAIAAIPATPGDH